jgi:hypothetical protein
MENCLHLATIMKHLSKFINYFSVKPNFQQECMNNVHLLLSWPYLSALEHNKVFVEVLSECHSSYFITFKLACIFQWKSQLSPQISTALPVKLSLQVITPKNMQLSWWRSFQCISECNDMFNQVLHEAKHILHFKSQFLSLFYKQRQSDFENVKNHSFTSPTCEMIRKTVFIDLFCVQT